MVFRFFGLWLVSLFRVFRKLSFGFWGALGGGVRGDFLV